MQPALLAVTLLAAAAPARGNRITGNVQDLLLAEANHSEGKQSCCCKKSACGHEGDFQYHQYTYKGAAVCCKLTAGWRTDCEVVGGYTHKASEMLAHFASIEGYEDGACAIPKCPRGMELSDSKQPECRCPVGFRGKAHLDWKTSTWQQRSFGCTAMKCPKNAEGHPACRCRKGFTGLVRWGDGRYEGSCRGVCPAHAEGFPACRCKPGYRGTLQLDEASGKYHGSCEKVPCPASTVFSRVAEDSEGLCGCELPGFAGVEWDQTTQSYRGECESFFVKCPSGAVGFPCRCGNGYVGTLTWDQVRKDYNGSCRLAYS